MSVLIVDDSPSIRYLISSIVEDMGFECLQAASGEEALAYITSEQPLPLLVILDIGLPGIDGYETAAQMKAIADIRHLPVIFLTSAKDKDILSKCLSVGDDYVAKPFTEEMITSKVEAHRRVSEVYLQLEQQYSELRRLQYRIDLEHKVVESIFSNQFERHISESDNLRYHISPKSVFNGDLLLTAHGPSGSLYVAVGDVTGHGLPAAVGAIPAYPTFRSMALAGQSVGKIAFEMNSSLLDLLPDNMLVAASLLELNRAGDTLTVWSGGMPPMVICDHAGNLKQLIQPTRSPLGMLAEQAFIQDVQLVHVDPGDKVFLFTDGVEESRNTANEMFGESRLHQLFDGSEGNMFDRIIEQFKRFTQGQEQDDDITLVELHCVPNSHCEPQLNTRAALKNILPWSLSYQLNAAQMKAANPIPQIVQLLSSAAGLDVHQDYISTILSEAYQNALEHGLLKLDSELKGNDDGFIEYHRLRQRRLTELVAGTIDINITFNWHNGLSTVLINVTDSGDGFDFNNLGTAQARVSYGRGITLLKELCDKITFSDNGRSITLEYST